MELRNVTQCCHVFLILSYEGEGGMIVGCVSCPVKINKEN
jgi:hypothetical protein